MNLKKSMFFSSTQEIIMMLMLVTVIFLIVLAHYFFGILQLDYLILWCALLGAFFLVILFLKGLVTVFKCVGIDIDEPEVISPLLNRVFYACWWYLASVSLTAPILLTWFVYKTKGMFSCLPKV